MRVARFDRVPEPEDTAEVGWFEISTERPDFQKIGETSSYNWQQGAMLQFLGPDFNSRVIWNVFDGETYKARIVGLENGETREVPAIYNLFPDGKSATTIDFERHAWCRRGYSYGNIMRPEKNQAIVPGDAIWRIDLETGERAPIVTLEAMMRLAPHGTMLGATHYLEHMTANPSGDLLAFLHRWRHENGIHSRLLAARPDGSDVRILNDSGRMSHFCWCTDTELLGYGGKTNPVNAMRRNRALLKSVFRPMLPIYKRLIRDSSVLAKSLTGDAYYIFDTVTPSKPRQIVPSMRAEDGHPAMLPGGRYFITDTYARAAHGQKPRLIAVDLENDSSVMLDDLGSIATYDETPMRCDLHPRVSPGGDIVSIDTMDRGQRGIYAYRVEVG